MIRKTRNVAPPPAGGDDPDLVHGDDRGHGRLGAPDRDDAHVRGRLPLVADHAPHGEGDRGHRLDDHGRHLGDEGRGQGHPLHHQDVEGQGQRAEKSQGKLH